MKTPGVSMMLFAIAALLGAVGQFLYKSGADRITGDWFIWAALIALAAYGTPIKPVNVAGMGLLVAGMFLMGK